MKKLSYRGIHYQKPETKGINTSASNRVQGNASHVYRGAIYHYELTKASKKAVV